MRKVNVTFKFGDGAYDKQYAREGEAYRIDQNYIVSIYEDEISIDPITSEVDGKIIVDFDDSNYKDTIHVDIQNVKVIDVTNSAVTNFLKYLISCEREK